VTAKQPGQAALAAECRTDPVILGRVRSALLGQLGGTIPAVPAEALGPSAYMDRRTVTPLTRIRRDTP
jgi:hypothetical protein